MDELKPCPFCGDSAIVGYDDNHGADCWIVSCTNWDCGAMVSFIDDPKESNMCRTEAIKLWNRRV